MSLDEIAEIAEMARQVRCQVIRTVFRAGGGHIGGPLSAADILAGLYFHELRIRPHDPQWPERDRFVLSKGHASNALYAVLALRGYFPIRELESFDRANSQLQGHPDMTLTPGVDMSSGSLGTGLSAAVGMALGARLKGLTARVYALLGDGECQEGEVWEAAFVAHRYKLSNLLAIIDCNDLQQYGWAGDRPDRRRAPWDPGELGQRWTASGWHVVLADGHDLRALLGAFAEARGQVARPSVVLAQTVKGKGVSFMESDYSWHTRVPTAEEYQRALIELGDVP